MKRRRIQDVTASLATDEQEANYFAMHLLAPDSMLRLELDRLGAIDLTGDGNFSAIQILARKFEVSETVIAFRLGELLFKP